MDRGKQIQLREQPDGQITNIGNINVSRPTLSSDYEIVVLGGKRVNGLLRVFSLVPKSATGAKFDARLDDGNPGNRRRAELDIDIRNVSARIQRDFKRKKPTLGYSGHHSNVSSDPYHHEYEVDIQSPHGVIFNACVSFDVTFYDSNGERLDIVDSSDATVTRTSAIRHTFYRCITLFERYILRK